MRVCLFLSFKSNAIGEPFVLNTVFFCDPFSQTVMKSAILPQPHL